jgi:hypothetical protein
MLPMTSFGVWGLSLSMATITTSVGFKVILRRTERLLWAAWATMGGLAHEHIGHRARSPFGHRDGVPPVCLYCLSARLPLVSLAAGLRAQADGSRQSANFNRRCPQLGLDHKPGTMILQFAMRSISSRPRYLF